MTVVPDRLVVLGGLDLEARREFNAAGSGVMDTVAVVAHSGKTLEGGLGALRDELVSAGVVDPLWFEVPKSKIAPKRVRKALDAGAELIFVWGGDGMVQRCIDTVIGSDATLAI